MPLDIFNDDKFKEQDYDTRLKVVDNYFNKKVATSEKFKSLAPEQQAKVRDNIIKDNVGMPTRSWKETLRDAPFQIGTGVGNTIEMVGDIYGLASGNMDNKVSGMGKTISDTFSKEYSKPLKQLEEITQKEIDKEDGEINKFLKTLEVTATNPALASKFIVESLPMLVATGGAGRAAKVITGSAKAGTWGAIGTGGALQGADMGSSAYDSLMKQDDKYWNQVPEYQEAVKNGINPKQAKHDISINIARVVAGASGALSVGANKLVTGGSTIEDVITGNGIASGMLKGGVKGAVGEGTTEALEEGGGQAFQNIGVQQVNPDQQALQGVGQATGTGMVAGGITGGGFGAVGGAGTQPNQVPNQQPQATQPIQPQQQPTKPIEQKTPEEIINTPMSQLVEEIKQSSVFGETKAKAQNMAVDIGEINYDSMMPQEAQPQQMNNTANASQTLDDKDTNISNRVKNSISKFNNEDDFVNTSPKMGAKSVSDILGYIDQNTNGQLNFDEVRNSIGETKSFFKDKINIDNLNIQDADIVAKENINRGNIDLSKPIVVDAKGNIIDGRHRVVFAKQNGITELDAYIPANMFYQKNANQNINQNPAQGQYDLNLIDEFEGLTKYNGHNSADILQLEKPTSTTGIRNAIKRYQAGNPTPRDLEILDAVQNFMVHEGDNFRGRIEDKLRPKEEQSGLPQDMIDDGYQMLDSGEIVDKNGQLLFSKKAEDTKDLIVQHNLSEANLRHAIKNGGLLVPSLAITKKDNPLGGFGEITLLGDKELADPKGYAKTKVFGADIYSPRYPRATVDYKPADIRKMDKDLESYSKYFDGYSDIRTSSDVSNLKDNVAMKMKFLKEVKGYDVKFPTLNEADENLISKTFPNEYKKSIENKGVNVDTLINDEDFRHRVIEDFKKTLDLADGNHDKLNTFTPEQIDRIIKHKADSINKIGRNSGKIDFIKLRQTVTDEVNKYDNEFDDYVNNFTSQFESKSYFYDNNTKKAFNETNVIKAMIKNLRGGEGFNYGTGSLRAMVTPQFKSIKEIKANSDKLVTHDDFQKVKEEVESELLSLANKVAPYYKYQSSVKQFGFSDGVVGRMLAETPKGINRALTQYDFDNVPEDIKKEIADYVMKLKNMPTEYFEAKITRVVNPSEFHTAVVSDKTSQETLDYLEKQGIKVKVYSGDAEARAKAIKEAAEENDLLFSKLANENKLNMRDFKQRISGKEQDIKNLIKLYASGKKKQPLTTYRGVASEDNLINNSTGAASEGYGLYTTLNKKLAQDYGKVIELDGKENTPANPLVFEDYNQYEIFMQQLMYRVAGYSRASDFGNINPNEIVNAIMPEADGIQIGTGSKTFWVKFPNIKEVREKQGYEVLESKFKQANSTTRSEAISQTKKLLGKQFDRVTQGIEFLQSANELPQDIQNALHSVLAYHGTPHNVDNFSTKYIGSGEGNQAYGWGMYFADSKEVAKWYRDNLQGLKNKYKPNGYDVAEWRNQAKELYPNNQAKQDAWHALAQGDFTKGKDSLIKWGKENAYNEASRKEIENVANQIFADGNLYRVELKPKEEEYLLWDKPLSEQSNYVKNALEKKFSLASFIEDYNSASSFYQSRVRKFDSDKEASLELNSLGIKGIKYLDGNSRDGKQEKYNYVIFADENVGKPELLMSGGIPRGIFDPKTNKIYLIADAMKSSEVQGVVLHELLHRAINDKVADGQTRLEAILGSNLNPLVKRLEKLAELKDKDVLEAIQKVKDAKVPKENQTEEIMTYLLENQTNAKNQSPMLQRWIKDTIQAIKDFIRKTAVSLGIEPNWFISKMNTDDIVSILRDTAINSNVEKKSNSKPMASKKSRLTEWHKDSHALTKNEDGTPKVFYHQTSKEAAKSIYSTKFDISKVGARGSDNVVPDGFFFKTNDNDIRVGTNKKENIEQMPVYLKIKNPFMAKDRESFKWQMSVESKKYKSLLDEAKQIDNYFGRINDDLETQVKEVSNKLKADKENKKLTDKYNSILDKIDENLTKWEEAVNKNAELSRKEIKDTLQKLGYDGLNLANDEGSFGRKVNTFIAFEPTQIKSVNNKGSFDESNPNILHSKNGLTENQQGRITKLKNWLNDKAYDIKTTKGIATLLYLTARQQKADLFKDIAPELQVYDDIAESKMAEANRNIKVSAEIAEKTRKWAVKNKAEADKLFKFMGETTIEGIDPTKSYESQATRIEKFYTFVDKVGLELEGKGKREKFSKEKYDYIKAKWDNLSPEAKDIYETMKDHYETLADKMFVALRDKITKSDMDEKTKASLMDKLRLEMESNKIAGPYFPLMRFGEYIVRAKDKDGELVVERYETPSERDNRIKEMEKEGFTNIKSSADVEANHNLQADTAFMSDILKDIEKKHPEAFNQISEDVYQLYLKYLPNMSARKAFIHRKGIKGYSEDMLRAFASRTYHLGRQIANINHLDKMQNQIDKLGKRVEKTGDPKLKAIYEDLLKTHDHIVNPPFKQWQVALTSLGFYWFMTSLSAGILNLTQVPMVVYPRLTGKYGATKSFYHLNKAVKDLVTGNLTDDEKAFMEKMKDEGIIDLTMAHDLAGLGDHYNDIQFGAMTDIKRIFAAPQHYSEVANRMVTLLSTYRLAKGKGENNPTAVAKKTNYETNFNYSNENRPSWMRSPTQKVIFQFKTYSAQMLYFILKNTIDMFKGDRKVEAVKTIGTLFAVSWILAGARGMPLQVFYALAGVAGVDEPEDELYAKIKELLPEYADLIWRGFVNTFSGADLGSRSSLNELLVKAPIRELNTKDTFEFYTTQLLGPSLSIFTNMGVGIHDIATGEYGRGLEKTMPKPIKDIIQAARFADEGARDYDFKPIVDKEEFNARDLVTKAVGFQPEKLAKQQESNMRTLRRKQIIDNERSAILKQIRKADFRNNPELWKESMKKVEEFNSKYPELAIKNDTIIKSIRGANRDRLNAENGLNISGKYNSQLERYK